MSYFHVIKRVLDELFVDVPGGSPEQKYQAITSKIIELSSRYFTLTEAQRVPISYSDPLSKFAYVYMYTACHAELIKQISLELNLIPSVISDPSNFRATCVGGGPGSDVIGLLDAYSVVGGAKNFHAWLIDREASWGDCWGEISRLMNNQFTVTTQVEPVNLLDDASISAAVASARRFLRPDLVTMSFFISELYSYRDQAHLPLVRLLSSMRSGAKVLFIDNNDKGGAFSGWFDQISSDAGLICEAHDARNMSIAEKEQKVALGEYFNNIGRQPKQNANVVFRVCMRP
jgi:hypothetical protein